MKYEIPYGKRFLEFELDGAVETLMIKQSHVARDKRELIREAMEHPISSLKLKDMAKGKKNAVIVINDITRPSPSGLFVEEVSRELNAAGIPDSEITILVATGNHRANTEQELKGMLGDEVYKRFTVKNHNALDSEQLVDLGKTKRGLQVVVNRLVVESDLTILTGIITPHQSAGFSGGRKSIVPGVAGSTSIEQHHSFPIRPDRPVMGELTDNTFHDESLEAAQKTGVDFIVNVVKNSNGEITTAVAGDMVKAHEKGVNACKAIWQIDIEGLFDITIVSPGGYPKDFDMHQAQKGLATAEMITKQGGSIILAAECPDGVGKFAEILMKAHDPQEVIDYYEEVGFQSKNHTSKAYTYARVLQKHDVYFVTDKIDSIDLKKMFFIPSKTINRAYQNALAKSHGEPRVAFVPYAVDCLIQTHSKEQSRIGS